MAPVRQFSIFMDEDLLAQLVEKAKEANCTVSDIMRARLLEVEKDVGVRTVDVSDIYVDADGKLWRCVLISRGPSVMFEEVESAPTAPRAAMTQGPIDHSGWDGWKRIFRPARPEAPGTQFAQGGGQ